MKYRYCGLILCLSIVIGTCGEIYTQEETEAEAVEVVKSTMTEESKKDSDQKLLLEEYNDLTKLTNELIKQYKNLSNKIDMLDNKYENLSVAISTLAVDIERIMLVVTTLIEDYGSLNNKVTELALKLDNIYSGREIVLEKTIPEETSKRTSEDTAMQQYVKVKVKEK
ncbi:MAG: hypothetical protein QME68_08315, partial [Elusimicrobiota bacterium]|nr:hypothetical protein [Elusimicrobiota bacterium]